MLFNSLKQNKYKLDIFNYILNIGEHSTNIFENKQNHNSELLDLEQKN